MWYQEREEGALLYVKVVPASKNSQIVGIYGDFLKVKISAPPEKGKANQVLADFLAKKLGVGKNSVKIVKGQTQAIKIVFVPLRVEELLKIIKK